jgi:hypothetical protein
MGNPLFWRELHLALGGMIGLAVIFGGLITWAFGAEFSVVLPFWVIGGGIMYLPFLIDKALLRRAKTRIEAELKETPMVLEFAHHRSEGYGVLAVTQNNLVFVAKKSVYAFPVSTIRHMGTGSQGTGGYVTHHSDIGGIRLSATTEGRVRTFWIKTDQSELVWVIRKPQKIFKALDRVGHFVGELDQHKVVSDSSKR